MQCHGTGRVLLLLMVAAAPAPGTGLMQHAGWAKPSTGSPTDIGPLPPVQIPPDNPMTPEKIELGKMLFFDYRLSGDGSRTCVHCHEPDQGWSFKDRQSPAYPTQVERRASMTLIVVANGELTRVEPPKLPE